MNIRNFALKSYSFVLFPVAIFFILFFTDCNPNKNTAATRNYQAFLTRYNIQYNGDKHYKETVADMENNYEDNYDDILYVHPAETRGLSNTPQPVGDFTRSIEKAQKAIQLHSIKKQPRGRIRTAEDREWKSRGEYNPYLHNSWLLMGKTLYMQGDFEKASAIFMYISRHFRWLPSTVTEAKIWEARCYCALGWLYEAEDILDGIDYRKLQSKENKRQYLLAVSSLAVRQKNYKEAARNLEKVIDFSTGSQKTRLRYLLGQVFQRAGESSKAYETYSKIANSITTDYRTRISARIAMSEVSPPAESRKEIARLLKLVKYESNIDYRNRLYFAMGNLYLASGDTMEALDCYKKSVLLATNPDLPVAQSEIAIGRIFYDKGEYAKAQPYYSSALPLLPANYPDFDEIKKRSDILDRYAVYAYNVALQDSLLALADMSFEQRMEICDRLAREYRKEQDNLRRKEQRDEQLSRLGSVNLGGRPATISPAIVTQADQDIAWYFYNPQTVRAGQQQFQQIWGNRRQEDDWRRRDKTSFGTMDFADSEANGSEEIGNAVVQDDNVRWNSERVQENDPANAEYYLRDIPTTIEARDRAHEIIISGLYNMAVILKNDIKDYRKSIDMFNDLLGRYPDNIYRLDSYDNLFLIYAYLDDKKEMDYYQNLIVTEFPESPLGIAMKRPGYFNHLKRQNEIQDSLYVAAYNAYMGNVNPKVHEIVRIVTEDYPTSSLMPKFLFLDAMAYATDGNRNQFKNRITELLARYPKTDLTPVASGIMTNLNAGRLLGENSGNMQGTVFDTRLTEEPEEPIRTDSVGHPLFLADPDSPQLFIFAFPASDVSANKLLYDIGRHNFETFMAREFDIEQFSSGNLSLIIVSGLANRKEAERYGQILYMSEYLDLPHQVVRVIISVDDFNSLRNSGMSLGQYLRYIEGSRYRDAQEMVLPNDVYEIESLY